MIGRIKRCIVMLLILLNISEVTFSQGKPETIFIDVRWSPDIKVKNINGKRVIDLEARLGNPIKDKYIGTVYAKVRPSTMYRDPNNPCDITGTGLEEYGIKNLTQYSAKYIIKNPETYVGSSNSIEFVVKNIKIEKLVGQPITVENILLVNEKCFANPDDIYGDPMYNLAAELDFSFDMYVNISKIPSEGQIVSGDPNAPKPEFGQEYMTHGDSLAHYVDSIVRRTSVTSNPYPKRK